MKVSHETLTSDQKECLFNGLSIHLLNKYYKHACLIVGKHFFSIEF